MFAANYNRVDAMKVLLAAGANINQSTNVVDLASLTKPGFGGRRTGRRTGSGRSGPGADKPRRPRVVAVLRRRVAVRLLLPAAQGPGRGPGAPGAPAGRARRRPLVRAGVRVAAVAAVTSARPRAVPISPASRVSSASTSSSPRRAG